MARKNTLTKVTKAEDWTGARSLADFASDYRVYPRLTAKLDADDWKFSDQSVNEIVLWKLGRYVQIPSATLKALDKLRILKPGKHRKSADVLEQLLSCKGVRLPMASTLLRFANPQVFQIYDRHICRAVKGTCDAVAPKHPHVALGLYWKFLDDLITLCGRLNIPFRDADRILFEFDKSVNPPLSPSSD